MKKNNLPGLDGFLRDYPGMSIASSRNSSLMLHGVFDFTAQPEKKRKLTDSYCLEITVPVSFPENVPTVIETERKIPRNAEYHVNPNNSLCLGSPLRLLLKLSQNPSLVGFAENCLVPYLYAISHKLHYGGELPLGELAHAEVGIINDYMDLFRLQNVDQVKRALEFLGMKKRLANKKPCPCGCGKRLGTCPFHRKINELRKVAKRPWFRAQIKYLSI